ncbi:MULTISPECIES: D-aminoacyl-tRNA deacylase [unclassified Corynebacterium]|uniref:D-aminoacyl-tRNA deacylase n=1 Tax=unclassified Corynebacterium TaxID=2624378 RepID=UPI0035241CDC
MKAVLTRVSHASVTVDEELVGEINCPETCGVLALVGVARGDGADASRTETMIRKIAELRILPGEESVESVGAPVLIVSQFTLQGKTVKGRRPSWSDAAPSDEAEPIINAIAEGLRARGIPVAEGRFGAMMRVSSVNEGPFTVLVDC